MTTHDPQEEDDADEVARRRWEVDAATVAAWLTRPGKSAAAGERWPSLEILEKAAPDLAGLVNWVASPRIHFAHLAPVRPFVPPGDPDLDPDLRRELEAEEAELLAKLRRQEEVSPHCLDAVRHRRLRDRLGLPEIMFHSTDMIRRRPPQRPWQSRWMLFDLGVRARDILVEAGCPKGISAGSVATGVVAHFLVNLVQHLYPDPRVERTSSKTLRTKAPRPVTPEMVAEIIGRNSRKR